VHILASIRKACTANASIVVVCQIANISSKIPASIFAQHEDTMERSLVILKPDAVQRGLVGTILGRLEARGLKIIGMKLMQVDEALARKHYAIHEGKLFFEGTVQYIVSGPVVVLAIAGDGVIPMVRSTVGATNPANAVPGTIRGDFAVSIGRNLIHASDSPGNGETEVSNFFTNDELLQSFTRDTDRWIFEQ